MLDRVRLIGLFCLGLAVSLPGSLRAQEGGDVQKVITQLNAASAKFQSAQADFTWDVFQAAVQDHVIQTGTIYYERKKDGGGTQVAAYIKQENGKDAPKTVTFNGSEAYYYVPAINQVNIFQ